ncbi:MIP/aquaporin family protein [Ruania zhangjianzhongii]|uniref:MIP/aquaporin family protein n=1 Tax=Ruania zhangjianzhongii TaxID=2603206 RepID=UPI0011C7B0A9|nr:aquaporin [Ruania zhangjianzhongii]
MTSQTDTVDYDTGDVATAVAPPSLFARFAAEFLGTFLLVFIGFGVTLYSGVITNPDESLRMLSWGVALLVAIALFGHVSGGHFNPAVTLGSAIVGRTSWADVLVYWVGQLAGAAGAAGLLFLTIPAALPTAVGAASKQAMFNTNASGYGEHSMVGQLSSGQVSSDLVPVLLIEVIATALFVGVALMAHRWVGGKRVSAGVVTGLAYGALSVTAYTLSGGALNPARATAGAVFAEGWALGQLWLFWAAPIVGAVIAALLVSVFAPDPLPVYDDEDYDEDEDVDEEYDDGEDTDHEVELDGEGQDSATADDPGSIPEESTGRDDAFTEDYDVTADYDEDTPAQPDKAESTDAEPQAEAGKDDDEPDTTPGR